MQGYDSQENPKNKYMRKVGYQDKGSQSENIPKWIHLIHMTKPESDRDQEEYHCKAEIVKSKIEEHGVDERENQ